jgi:hypothetical protein
MPQWSWVVLLAFVGGIGWELSSCARLLSEILTTLKAILDKIRNP